MTIYIDARYTNIYFYNDCLSYRGNPYYHGLAPGVPLQMNHNYMPRIQYAPKTINVETEIEARTHRLYKDQFFPTTPPAIRERPWFGLYGVMPDALEAKRREEVLNFNRILTRADLQGYNVAQSSTRAAAQCNLPEIVEPCFDSGEKPVFVPDLQTLARFDNDHSLQSSLDLDFTGIDPMSEGSTKACDPVSSEQVDEKLIEHCIPVHSVKSEPSYKNNFVPNTLTEDPKTFLFPHIKKLTQSWSQDRNRNDLVDFDVAEDFCRVSTINAPRRTGTKRKLEDKNIDMKVEERTGPGGSPIPLKKRPRMYQLAYPIGHGINKQAMPVLTFTFEEEFLVMDFVVRIEEYQNSRFEFLLKNFRNYKELLVSYVECTKLGCKIPFSKGIEKTLFKLGLEFTKSNIHRIFKEMGILSSEVRKMVLNSTYPALYVVFFSILEGNASEVTWLDQHKKTIHITEHHIDIMQEQLMGFRHVRSINLRVWDHVN